jgi:hypothetical protein
MVNAIAPNAPIGAARTTMPMMRKNILPAMSIAEAMRWPVSPMVDTAKPLRMEISSTCSRSPLANASKNELGMIASRWATMPSSLARVT